MSERSRPLPRARWLLIALALACAAGLGADLARVPVQYPDSFDAIARGCAARSSLDVFRREVSRSSGTLRPLRPLQARALCQLSSATGASLTTVFRGAHIALATLALLLFVLALPVDGWADVPAAALALAVLGGHHAISALWMEAFPVNHYLEVVVATTLVLLLAGRPPRAWAWALLLAVLAGLLLLFETSLLIWAAIVLALIVRLPGVRVRTAVAATVLVALYFLGRGALGLSAVSLGRNGTGLWTTMLSASALEQMTGLDRLGMLAYNMAGSVLSVVFSEPRSGIFALLRARDGATLSDMTQLNLASSILATALIALWAGARARRRTPLEAADRIGLVGLGLILATAPLAAGYIKDEILAVAAVGYACACYAAARHALASGRTPGRTPARAGVAVVALTLIATLWSVRAAGAHYRLAVEAFKTRNDWAHVVTEARPGDEWTPEERRLLATLRQQALLQRITAPEFLPRWADGLWGEP